MKTLIKFFSVLMVVMGSFVFGQKMSSPMPANNFESEIYKATMVGLVSDAKQYYRDGINYEEFVQNLGGDSRSLSSQESTLIKEIYAHLSKKSDNSTIYASTDGLSLKTAMKSQSFQNFNSTSGKACGFLCKLGKILVILGNTIGEILGVLALP